MRFVRLILVLLIIIFFAIIYTQNIDVFTHSFELQLDLKSYLIGPYITQNIVLILTAFVIGVILSLFFGALQSVSASSEIRQNRRLIKELESQVEELSNNKSGPAAPEPDKEVSDSPFSPAN